MNLIFDDKYMQRRVEYLRSLGVENVGKLIDNYRKIEEIIKKYKKIGKTI